MTKLLPCPFCGGEAKVFSISCSDDENDDILDHVFCTACDASMCQQDKSVEMWNKRASQWQPIDTAPKDGTWVLLYEKDGTSIHAGRFNWTDWYPAVQSESDEWIKSFPSHWQPLPPPPKENDDEKTTA